jgi:hypothetical protein
MAYCYMLLYMHLATGVQPPWPLLPLLLVSTLLLPYSSL